MRRRLVVWLTGIAVAGALCTAAAAAQSPVDVALVIAVDVSRSMDMDEQGLQREGYVAAFRNAQLHRAIASGPHGRIAVVYMEWAGPTSQRVTVPWTMIDSAAAARAFADRLAAQPISRDRLTSVGAALDFAGSLLAAGGFTALRRVVDVSGDGPNNAGPSAPEARDRLVAAGIVVNGLPIVLKVARHSLFDIADLDRYYAACVIGGPGAFMLPVTAIAELQEAIRRKLLLEISWGAPPLRAVPAQAAGPEPAQPSAQPPAQPYDCLVGEKRWRQFLDGVPN